MVGYADGQAPAPAKESDTLQTEDGRGVSTVDDRNAGALGAVQNPSADRATGNSNDMALSSDGQNSGGGDLHDLGKKLRESVEGACESMGIPKEYANKIMGMFGMDPAMIEMAMSIIQKLSDHGVQGQGGELGNPQANLAPPAVGVEQPSQDLQLADR